MTFNSTSPTYLTPPDGSASSWDTAERQGAVRWATDYWEHMDWCVIPAHRATSSDGVWSGGCTCGKRTCGNAAGKHPIGLWKEDAIPRAEFRARWDRPYQRGTYPRIATWQANLSLLLGARSRVIVADIDPRHGGRLETLWALGWSQDTCIERTGGGGWHVYAACPAEGLRTRHDYAQGIEVLADGAQVIVTPSKHLSGRHYTWEPGHAPWERAPAPLAEHLLADLAAYPVAEGAVPVARVPGQYVYPREETKRIADNMYRAFLRTARKRPRDPDTGITIGRNLACFRLGIQLATLGFSDDEIAAWGAALAEDLAGGVR